MRPQFADLDADGHVDFLTGSYDGRIYLVRGGADGWTKPAALLDAQGNELRLGMYWDFAEKHWVTPSGLSFGERHAISVTTIDWDGDGDLDLVVGTDDAKLFRWTNLGARAKAAFAPTAEPVLVGKEPVVLTGGHSMPTAADWDQDGLVDLVVGTDDGAVRWLRNVGTKSAPVLEAPRELVAKAPETDAARSGKNVIVEVADLDGDGDLDLLVGDHEDEDVVDPRTAEEKEKSLELVKQFNPFTPDEKKALAGDEAAARKALGDARVEEYHALLKEMKRVAPPKVKLHARVWFHRRVREAESAMR
ncbi:MAG: VCBS repeat-containing protein [Planctomycetes bacterium]|nr:VCBS repeat-containing protein [Planctomycetota bacterium]